MVGFWNLIIVWLKVGGQILVNLFVTWLTRTLAPVTVAVLSPMGSRGWHRSAGKYGPVYGQQLFDLRFLEELAQKLQSLDRQVIASSSFNLRDR